MRRTVAIGAGLPEGRDRAIDQARVERRQRRVIRTEPAHDAGAVALDEDVGGAAKGAKRRPSRGRFEVEDDALLAAVQRAEEDRGVAVALSDGTAGIALARRLDLDHLGAVIGERQGQIGAGQESGEIDDAQPLELHRRPASAHRVGRGRERRDGAVDLRHQRLERLRLGLDAEPGDQHRLDGEQRAGERDDTGDAEGGKERHDELRREDGHQPAHGVAEAGAAHAYLGREQLRHVEPPGDRHHHIDAGHQQRSRPGSAAPRIAA